MAQVEMVTTTNQKAGSIDLDAVVFEAPVRPHLHHAEVRRQLAARRAGTHSTRNRSAVSGGGSKPWRQKGTGRARQGSTRSPQWAGGGAVFGPVPRGYEHKLPKKMRRAALRSALSQRLQEQELVILDALSLPEGRTRHVAEVLRQLGLVDERVLLVLPARDDVVERASRNLPRVRTVRAEGLNVYDVLWASRVVMTRDAVGAVEARLGDREEGAPEAAAAAAPEAPAGEEADA